MSASLIIYFLKADPRLNWKMSFVNEAIFLGYDMINPLLISSQE